jgi:hypothetical protein
MAALMTANRRVRENSCPARLLFPICTPLPTGPTVPLLRSAGPEIQFSRPPNLRGGTLNSVHFGESGLTQSLGKKC